MTRRRVILLSFDWTRAKDPPMSLGHASLVTHLRAQNVPVSSLPFSVTDPTFSVAHVLKAVERAQADSIRAAERAVLGVGAFVWNEPAVQHVTREAKRRWPALPIVLGGPQVSYVESQAELEQLYPYADVFVRGYGENALLRYATRSAEHEPIRGVLYRGVPSLAASTADVPLDNLESPFLSGVLDPQRFLRWETQRGCPFQCSFCQHRESAIGTASIATRRAFDKARVVREAQWLCDNRALVRDVAVVDPTFNSGPHYLQILDELVHGGFDGRLSLQCRPEMVKRAFLDAVEQLVRRNGAHVVLEFGVQTIHKAEWKEIERAVNLGRVEDCINECNARGIDHEVSLIYGLPHQTLESFRESVDFFRRLRVPRILAFPLMLLRGTPLHARQHRLGLVEEVSSVRENVVNRIELNIPHVVASPTFSRDDWLRMRDVAIALAHDA